MGTDGPSIDAEAERQEGEEETGKIGGEEETGDVMRDAPEEKMEGKDGGRKKKSKHIVVCVWLTLRKWVKM